MGPASIERFDIEGFRCEIPAGAGLVDPAAAASRVSDPAAATDTVHWGRNYLYGVILDGTAGDVAAVVKLFRNQGWRRRLERRLKGSKAERSFRMALAVRDRGVRTPEPLLLLESKETEGPSIFVSRRIENAVEARYMFRALKASTFAVDFPGLDPEALPRAIARTARQLHDAGFWHRDFSIGNLLVSHPSDGSVALDLIDLNRARNLGRVGVGRRTRDLCRLGFYDDRLDRLFLETYWEGRGTGLGLKKVLYRLYRWAYLARVEGKKSLRSLTRGLGARLFLRKPYAHIPPPPEDADKRDKAVWDELSDQPHQHASRSERLRVRLGDAGSHLRAVSVAVAALPRARRRYRELRASLWSRDRPWPGIGIGIATAGRGERLSVDQAVDAVADLGVDQVLLRFHPWDESWDEGIALAAALAERKVDLVFALPQVRELVRDPGRWRRAVADLGERLIGFGNRFQIGQAINRSKWGLWNYREYVELMSGAMAELRALGPVEILGPGVIDFEPHALASALNYPGSPPVDIVSSLLYVDRRGAPENEQLGFDTLGKAALFRAIGETASVGSSRYWITEFNWPLWEGPHSPAGRAVSVDEERQASYLVRYGVPVLSSGLAERAYWWQLEARGYGLIEPRGEAGSPRRRSAYTALRTLQRELVGRSALGPVDLGGGVAAYRFAAPDGGGETLVAWCLGDDLEVTLPGVARSAVDRGGEALPAGSERARLSASPSYYRLDPS